MNWDTNEYTTWLVNTEEYHNAHNDFAESKIEDELLTYDSTKYEVLKDIISFCEAHGFSVEGVDKDKVDFDQVGKFVLECAYEGLTGKTIEIDLDCYYELN